MDIEPRQISRRAVTLSRYHRDRGAFTGAEKALLLCVGLAVVVLVGHLIGQGGRQAGRDARLALEQNPLATGRYRDTGPIPAVSQIAGQDPSRQKADQLLRGRLTIAPPGQGGELPPNQLTQAQYDQLAQLFANIDAGRTDIRFDPAELRADPKFKDNALADLAKLAQTRAGRDLIARMADNPAGNTLTVSMNRDSLGNPDTSNAYADASDPRQRANWGNGRGVPTTIRYVPGADVQIPGGTSQWLPLRGDVVLFHELVHAMHISRGTMDDSIVRLDQGASPLDVQSRIRNSEYQAVGLGRYSNDPITENRYRAERNKLRGQPGALPGDGTINRRTEYVVQTARVAPPP